MEQIKTPPTPRQLEILKYLKDYHDVNDYMPTYTEIMEQFKYKSKNSVHWMLKSLIARGLIYKIDGNTRAISLSNNISHPIN